MKEYDYVYADPTGNITLLVRDEVAVEEQPKVSNYLCFYEPDCEQVGFVYYDDPDADIRLRMAGGEFCGNATMSTACLFAKDNNFPLAEERTVIVRTSGTKDPVEVRVLREEKRAFKGCVKMPKPLEISEVLLYYASDRYMLPIVKFEGMYHIIYTDKMSLDEAEKAVVKWADDLNAPALGIMFLDEKQSVLTPLVYVPALKDFYWEHACASGTTATGYYLYKRNNEPVNIDFIEPGGKLNIKVDNDEEIFLTGHVRLRD